MKKEESGRGKERNKENEWQHGIASTFKGVKLQDMARCFLYIVYLMVFSKVYKFHFAHDFQGVHLLPIDIFIY
jgi:hypothetical protein